MLKINLDAISILTLPEVNGYKYPKIDELKQNASHQDRCE